MSKFYVAKLGKNMYQWCCKDSGKYVGPICSNPIILYFANYRTEHHNIGMGWGDPRTVKNWDKALHQAKIEYIVNKKAVKELVYEVYKFK